MSLTYRQIVDMVLRDAFAEGRRADAQTWVQFRHGWLWDLEPWTFKFATAPVVFTSGSQIATGPADLHAAEALFDSIGQPVRGVNDLRRFFRDYNANLDLGAASPQAYTIVDGQLFLSNKGDGSTGLLVYERSKPTLAADTDLTGLPDGYDLALVHGGKAEGFKLTNIPLADNFDADFTAATNVLRAGYLSNVHEAGAQFGAYRPGVYRPY